MIPKPATENAAEKASSRFGPALIAVAAAAAYAGSFAGPFVFDDVQSIPGNVTIRHLWPLGLPLHPPAGDLTVSGRPVLNLSLALNHAVSGDAVWSYHALNLIIHICAGLALLGVVRRTLRGPGAARAALAAALLWVVHPLQTESVTYVVQRAESLMGLFYLLTLYGFVRGCGLPSDLSSEALAQEEASRGGAKEEGLRTLGDSPPYAPRCGAREGEKTGRRGKELWFGLSWLACFFGMATKEVMVSAPLIVLLYDRTFLSGGFRESWRRHRGYYLSLAGTWLVLLVLVLGNGTRGGTSGLGLGVAFGQYARTQVPAIARYLGLCFWPHPLILDYGAQWIGRTEEMAPAAVLVGLIAAATAVGLWRRWPSGFLGAWFFAILAPSSLVPGIRQTMAEHRMYLPLAAVIVGVVGGGPWLLAKLGRIGAAARKLPWMAAALAAAVGLGALTARRNADYRSEVALWRATVADRPGNAYAHMALGTALARQGRADEGNAEYETAVHLDPTLLLTLKILAYDQALQRHPGQADLHAGLGVVLGQAGRLPEATGQFQQALRLNPRSAEAHNGLGFTLAGLGRLPEAIDQYREALRLSPDYAEAHDNLGIALGRSGRLPEAIQEFEAAIRIRPGLIDAHYNLAVTLAKSGRTAEAQAQIATARRLQAGD